MTTYINPQNQFEERADLPWLWTLLFGSFYFAYKGVWIHAAVSLVLAIITSGISWLIYPLFANAIVHKHYMHKGWNQKGQVAPANQNEAPAEAPQPSTPMNPAATIALVVIVLFIVAGIMAGKDLIAAAEKRQAEQHQKSKR